VSPARQPLSRTAILDAALAVADERGLDALSMRAVADRVGVTPMALYPHIGSKDALLDGLVDRLLAEFLPDAPRLEEFRSSPWPDRLRAIGHGTRDLAQRHPAVFRVLFSRPAVTADAVRVVDLIYQVLLDAGVADAEVPRLERLVTTFCMGFALSEIHGRFDARQVVTRSERGRIAPGSVPAHDRLGPLLDLAPDIDSEYDRDLDDLVAMVAATAAS
jgi:AcrR family transcriptional regulator